MLGFYLLEISIAWFVLAIGLLGLVYSENIAWRAERSAYWNSRAQVVLNDIFEGLAVENSPDGRALAVNQWQSKLASRIPSGSGEVLGEYPLYQVKVCWQSPLVDQKIHCMTEHGV